MSESSQKGDICISDGVSLRGWEVTEQFIRASGPGGQNVNKVSSAVQLRWNVDRSTLPVAVKTRFRTLWGPRITEAGDVIIEAKTHRSQGLNRDAARKRLADMIRKALHPPKRRIATRPGKRAVQRRIDGKKQRGALKATRGKISGRDGND